MYVLITSDSIQNDLQKAEDQIKTILVEYVRDPSPSIKRRLLKDLAANLTRNHHPCLVNQNPSESLQRSLSATSTGKVHPRDDSSLVTDRPRKMRKNDTEESSSSEEIIIPSWIASKKGWFCEFIWFAYYIPFNKCANIKSTPFDISSSGR